MYKPIDHKKRAVEILCKWSILAAVYLYLGIRNLVTTEELGPSFVCVLLAIVHLSLGIYISKKEREKVSHSKIQFSYNTTPQEKPQAISRDDAFEQWWQQICAAKLDVEIARSQSVAVQVFKKNPQKRTLEKIRVLNPTAAAYIEEKTQK